MNRPRMLGQAGATYGRHWRRRNVHLAPLRRLSLVRGRLAQDRRELLGGMCLSLLLFTLSDSRERPGHSTASSEDPCASRPSHRAWSARFWARLARLCRVRCSSIRRFIPPCAADECRQAIGFSGLRLAGTNTRPSLFPIIASFSCQCPACASVSLAGLGGLLCRR